MYISSKRMFRQLETNYQLTKLRPKLDSVTKIEGEACLNRHTLYHTIPSTHIIHFVCFLMQ